MRSVLQQVPIQLARDVPELKLYATLTPSVREESRLHTRATAHLSEELLHLFSSLKPPGPKEPGFRVDALSPSDTAGRP